MLQFSGARQRSQKTEKWGAAVATDTKVQIAEAAKRLLMDKKVKKLTIKDIVEECHITRQAFYYHFADIPELLQWMLQQGMDQIYQECRARGSQEEGLRYLFLVALNAAPYIRHSMETNYADEIETLVTEELYKLFEQLIEDEGLYQDCSRSQIDLFLRYHTQAIMGLIRTWTDNDTKNLDRIVHDIYLLVSGQIKP